MRSSVAKKIITPYSLKIGVLGAGTMGSGIALALLLSDLPVTLYDVSADMLDRAREYIHKHLQRKGKEASLAELQLTTDLTDLGSSDILIEAVPEKLGLKQDLFARLDALCPPPAILATNTSTLSVTAIAAATSSPERVAGMHFFNPASLLPLVEVVRGAGTSPETLQALLDLAGVIGKTPVVASDTPGFIVNRVARPFYGEALRLLSERVATHAQIDQIVRLGAGFRMGPFELMDLIGIDVNLAAMQSMYEQTFGEPRYRPHPIQSRMVQQGALGRKTGRGFYHYDPPGPGDETRPPELVRRSGQVNLEPGSWAPGLAQLLRQGGYQLVDMNFSRTSEPVMGIAPASRSEDLRKQLFELDQELPATTPVLCQCVDVTLIEAAAWMRHPERLVGFDGLFFARGRAATLVASPTLTPQARLAVEGFVSGLGRLPIWIEDSPALVLPRLLAMLANEAAFAVQEGVAEADTIDLAMQLGVNYPIGPLAWAGEIGYAQVIAILDHLRAEYGEDRYRLAPLLRRWARLGRVNA